MSIISRFLKWKITVIQGNTVLLICSVFRYGIQFFYFKKLNYFLCSFRVMNSFISMLSLSLSPVMRLFAPFFCLSVFSDFLVLVFRSKIFLYNFFFNSTRRIVLHLENKFANFSTMLLFQYLPALRRGFLLACNNVIISGMIAFSVVGSVPDNKICNFKLWKSWQLFFFFGFYLFYELNWIRV